MSDYITSQEIGLFRADLYQDESPESPREWDNVGTMCSKHRRYKLGDDDGWRKLREDLEERGLLDEYEDCSEEEMAEAASESEHFVVLPLYLLDHSGITISTSPFCDPWDSGQVGIIYTTMQRGNEEGFASPDDIERSLRAEVDTYDAYLHGDVYGYEVLGPVGLIESVWGLYGMDYAMEEMQNALKTAVETHQQQLMEENSFYFQKEVRYEA